jgi:hypothetical protein
VPQHAQLLLRVVALAQRTHKVQLRGHRLQRVGRRGWAVVQQAVREVRLLAPRHQPVLLLPRRVD